MPPEGERHAARLPRRTAADSFFDRTLIRTQVGYIEMNSKIAESLLRDKLRVKGYAWKTEQSYTSWFRRYMLFLVKTVPSAG